MRIFTPSLELPFAGHPRWHAWVLGPGTWTQHTREGPSPSSGQRRSRHDPARPELERVDETAWPNPGLPASTCLSGRAGGIAHLLVPTSAPLEGMHPIPRGGGPDPAPGRRCLARCGASTTHPHARYFVPGGVARIPARAAPPVPSGSWPGAVGHLGRRGGAPGRRDRPAVPIRVHAEEGAVRVGGGVTSSPRPLHL